MKDNVPIFGGGLERAKRPTNSKGHNFSTIQAAIDDMDIAGWIYVPPGTYTEAVDIVSKNNIMLLGAGWGMTKITYAGNDHTLDIDNSDDVIIRDLRIDQTTTGNYKHGIRLDDAQRCKIQDVYFGEADGSCIEFEDAASEECEVSNCYFTGAKDGGGIVDWNGVFCSKLKVSHSIFYSVPYAIYTLSNNVLIDGNLFISPAHDGITLDSNYGSVVTNNIILNGSGNGIFINMSEESIVTSNVIRKCASCGIDVYKAHHTSILNNSCISNSWGDLGSYGGITAFQTDYAIITGNVCYDDHSGCGGSGCQGAGINAVDMTYCILSSNVCRNNIQHGIILQGHASPLNSDYNTISNNICVDNSMKGIYILGEKGGGHDYANKNIVIGNQLFNNTGTNLDDDGTNTEIGHNITV